MIISNEYAYSSWELYHIEGGLVYGNAIKHT